MDGLCGANSRSLRCRTACCARTRFEVSQGSHAVNEHGPAILGLTEDDKWTMSAAFLLSIIYDATLNYPGLHTLHITVRCLSDTYEVLSDAAKEHRTSVVDWRCVRSGLNLFCDKLLSDSYGIWWLGAIDCLIGD